MKTPKSATELLEGAYAVQTAQDSLKYYADFAAIYDKGFAEGLGYIYPAIIASVKSSPRFRAF